MEYAVYLIDSKEEIESCPVFHIDHYQWRCIQKPRSYGKMGYLSGQGLFVRMYCEEENPKREKTQPYDRVCEDSALEAFFAFCDHPLAEGEVYTPSNDGLYLNFELNANGMLYAKYGYGRKDRHLISEEDYRAAQPQAAVSPSQWQAELIIPDQLIGRLTGTVPFQAGDYFYCNFYKTADDAAIEHYASFSPIDSETPNFHLPEQFARAVITQKGR